MCIIEGAYRRVGSAAWALEGVVPCQLAEIGEFMIEPLCAAPFNIPVTFVA